MANGSLNFSVIFSAVTQAFNSGVTGAAQNFQRSASSITNDSQLMSRTTQDLANKLQDVFKAGNAKEITASFKGLTQELNNTQRGANLTATDMRIIGQAGKAAVAELNASLKTAQAELKALQASKAVPADITVAKVKVAELRTELAQTGAEYSRVQSAAQAAMRRAAADTQALADSSKNTGQAIYSMLNIKSSGQLKAEISAIAKQLADFKTNSGAPASEIQRVTAAATAQIAALRASVNGTTPGMALLKNGISAIGPAAVAITGVTLGMGALKQGIDAVITSTIKYQGIMKQLEFATGSTQKAAEEYEYLLEVTRRLGLDLNSSAEGFAKLAASTKGTALEGEKTRVIFEGVASAAASLNLSAADTSGVMLAFSQIISKGKVSMEELRGQLGERLPGAMAIAAQSTGRTVAELEDMVAAGVDSVQFMEVFAPAMVKAFGPTAANNVKSLSGQMNLLNTEFDQLLIKLGNGGVGQAKIGIMSDLRDLIGEISNRIDSLDPSFVAAVSEVFEQLYGVVKETFVTLVNGVGEALASVNGLINGVSDVILGFGGMEQSAEQVGLVTRAIQGLSIVIGAVQDGIKAIDIAFTLSVGIVESFFSAIAFGLSVVTFGDLSRELEQLSVTLQDRAAASFEKAGQKAMEFKSAAVAAADSAIESHTKAGKVVGDAHEAGADKAKAAQTGIGQAAQESSKVIELSSMAGQKATLTIAAAGQEVIKSLQALAKESGVSLPAMKMTAEQVAQTMGEVAAKSDQAAVAIGKNLSEAISKLNTKDLILVWDGYLKGLEGANASTELLRKTNETFATQAFKLLGGDLTAALGKMSQGFADNVVILDRLIAGFDAMKDMGIDAAAAVGDALEGMLSKAKNATEISEIIKRWEDLGKQGKVTGQQMAEGLEAARKKLDEVKPGVNSVNEALRVLGQTANDSATNMQAKYAEAFRVLKDSGTATFTQLTQGLKTMFDAANDTKSLKDLAGLFQELGNKGKLASFDVAQGLADIENKLDAMKPGINSLAEAFKTFGMSTRQESAALADRYSQAFNVMRQSGQATAAELRQAFTQYAEAAVRANGGVVDGFVQSQAAALGLKVTVDDTGKVIIDSMNSGSNAVDSLGMSLERAIGSYARLGSAAQAAAEKALAAKEKELDLTERLMDAKQKEIDLENRRTGRDREGFSVDADGKRIEATVATWISTLTQLKNWGLNEEQARKLANEAFDERGNQRTLSNYRRNKNEDWNSLLRNAAEEMLRQTPLNAGPNSGGRTGGGGSAPSGGSGSQSGSTGSKGGGSGVSGGPSKTTTVILDNGNQRVRANLASEDEGKFLNMIGNARKAA